MLTHRLNLTLHRWAPHSHRVVLGLCLLLLANAYLLGGVFSSSSSMFFFGTVAKQPRPHTATRTEDASREIPDELIDKVEAREKEDHEALHGNRDDDDVEDDDDGGSDTRSNENDDEDSSSNEADIIKTKKKIPVEQQEDDGDDDDDDGRENAFKPQNGEDDDDLNKKKSKSPPKPPRSEAVGTPQQTSDYSPEAMRAWKARRFGLFIHWGLYSIPAGAYGKVKNHGEWIRDTAQIPIKTYDAYREQFNPTKFNAKEWVTLAKEAGMRYLVLTTKHHEGFCMYHSEETDFDMENTLFKRDIVRELSEEVRRQGLSMGLYHSIMDWHHDDYKPRRPWEKKARPADGADFERYRKYLHAQVRELLTRYGKIDVMWFDGEWERTWKHEFAKELYSECKRLQPEVLVNNRIDVFRNGFGGASVVAADQRDENGDPVVAVGDFFTPEQNVPAEGYPGFEWESCITMNNHWGYCANDDHWKSLETLVRLLVDTTSKGGNFLLNVGPRADGTFPEASVERLKGMGKWMKVNGESIHGCGSCELGRFPFGYCTKPEDTRDKIYLHVVIWPKSGKMFVAGVKVEKIKRAYFLARGKKSTLKTELVEDGFTVVVGGGREDEEEAEAMIDPIDTVVVVEGVGPFESTPSKRKRGIPCQHYTDRTNCVTLGTKCMWKQTQPNRDPDIGKCLHDTSTPPPQ